MAKTRKRAPASRRAEGEEADSSEKRAAQPARSKDSQAAAPRRRRGPRNRKTDKPAEAAAAPRAESPPKAPVVQAPVKSEAPQLRFVPAPPAPAGSDTDFGAGIFDDEPASHVAAPAAPQRPAETEDRPDVFDTGTRAAPASFEPDVFDAGTAEAPASDRGGAVPAASGDVAESIDHENELLARREKAAAARKDRRSRKSRKQRLEEEAEVIAALKRERERMAMMRDPELAAPELASSSAAVSDAAAEHFEEVVSEVFDPAQDARTERATDEGVENFAGDEDADDGSEAAVAEAPSDEPQERRGRRRRRRRRPGAPPEIAPAPEADEDSVPTEDDLEESPVAFDVDGEFEEVMVEDAESAEDEAPRPVSGERQEMLINVADAEECRIAIMRAGRLDELYIERASASSNVGNIYKGRVTNVEPSIQAAFVDFGLPTHGFLHISDLHPQYFPDSRGEPEQVGKKTPRRHRPPIQNCLRRGQEVIVQVIKEGIGTKGPTLSTYISIPGRFLVMMPGMDQLGVSRKIDDDEKRRKMRDILAQLSLPKNMGFIVRTAGVDRPKRDLQRDLNYLSRLWKKVAVRIKKEPAPAAIYKESDLVIRTIRDVFDSNLQRIIVDSPAVAGRVREFLAIASPRTHDVVEVYEGREPLFYKYGIEAEIERLHSKYVPLPCGGSLVIESTEAMVAIDVNSGRFRVHDDAEETAFRVNLEAVDEIARQLRLRDLGGLIVCDLIDMTADRHRRVVARTLNDALKKHKERAKVLPISRFGLLEMTRQRQGPSLFKSLFRECPRCSGSGRVKAPESVALDLMRQIRIASHQEGVARIDVRASTPVANDLLNRKRIQLADIERAAAQTICINGVDDFLVDQFEMTCSDRRGRDVYTARSGMRHVEHGPAPLAPPNRMPQGSPRPNGSAPHGQPRRHGEGRGRRRGGRRRRR